MQVIFIHHSCFLVEVDEKVLIFDWFAGDRIKGYTFCGVIPEYEPDTPVYVFASHKHQDHFDMDVLHWAEKYKNIHYIFSKDCKMSPHFLQKHGFPDDIREKITYVSAGEKYQVDDVKIETLRSTDAGVAFYVETRGATFFHAGDLNDWTWEGAGDLINGRMRREYRTQLKNWRENQSILHLFRWIRDRAQIRNSEWIIFWRPHPRNMCSRCICGRIIPTSRFIKIKYGIRGWRSVWWKSHMKIRFF